MVFTSVPKNLRGKKARGIAAEMVIKLVAMAKKKKLTGRMEFKTRHDLDENMVQVKVRPKDFSILAPLPSVFIIACFKGELQNWMKLLERMPIR